MTTSDRATFAMNTGRLSTALAGRYRIERELGAGGMATVYLAHDEKHDRKVAVKVLKPELAAVLGAERFVVEIKTTAALQHPHILPLFDSGEADGFLFYVMPFIDGETLRAKLDRETQLGIDDSVRITREVADALDYAHRHGVIHRDIKPENILLHDGRPIVADFGIALAVSAAAGGRMTETGLSLGTPHYMSPEQATAEKDITARSDVYSLGSVLYEMLAGKPPHTGANAQQIIMQIIVDVAEPVTKYRKSVPPNVVAAVAKALEKLPADRFESAKAFADALANTSYSNLSLTSAIPAPASSRRPRMRDAAFALVGAAVAAAMFFTTRTTPAYAPVLGRFRIDLPDSVGLTENPSSLALSRDGSRLAVVCRRQGGVGICLRGMDDSAVQVVRGTDGASYPSFSPDGEWLLFSAGGSLRKVPVSGGTPQTLADPGSTENSWGDGGSIVYGAPNGRDLWFVSSDGGNPKLLALHDSLKKNSYFQPHVLPGGRYALFSIWTTVGAPDSAHLAVISLPDGKITELGVNGLAPRYVAPGRIVFARDGGLLFSAPFSLRNRAVTGPAVRILEHMRQGTGGTSAFDVSHNGTLVYALGDGDGNRGMYVVDRHGKERALKGPLQGFSEPRVSPDGRQIAVRIGKGISDGGLWVYDIAAGTLRRLTADSGSIRGEWTRDGTRIVYVDHAASDTEIVISRPWDGSGAATVLARGGRYSFYEVALGPTSGWSAIRRGISAKNELLIAPTESLSAVRPFIAGSPSIVSPRVSPSGRLLAYSSNESGRFEIYVRQIPGPSAVVAVSVDGGTEPIWSADESTLFYRGQTRLMAATVVSRPVLTVTKRDSLFIDSYRRYAQHAAYDVFPNGREFVMTRGPVSTGSPLFVIVNWTRLLGKQKNADQ